MAFPVVDSITPSIFSTATTAHLVAMPATVNSGDLLLSHFAVSNATITTPSGWTLLDSTANGASVRLGNYYKIAAGTEGGTTVDHVTSATRRAVAHVYRLSGWHGTTPPEVGTAATGTSVSPDPPSLTPSWGADDTMWLAVTGITGVITVSAYPTSYTDGNDDQTSGASSSSIGSARRELNATSDDPAVFTIASAAWVAQTVAVRPAAAGAATLPARSLVVGTAVSHSFNY